MPELAVRELTSEDVPLIVNYWKTRSDENLILMGVDKEKLLQFDFEPILRSQLELPNDKKGLYYVIWMMDGVPIGHSNVNKIVFGEDACMHLHVWAADNRQKGIGGQMVLQSLQYYFNSLDLKLVYCEPNALNEAPNKTLAKVGFSFIKTYEPIPGPINFPHDQNRWEMTRKNYEQLPKL